MAKFLVKMPTKAFLGGRDAFYLMTYIKSILQLMSSVGNHVYYGLAIGRIPLERMISPTSTPLQRINKS
jgi:hypothetical protein